MYFETFRLIVYNIELSYYNRSTIYNFYTHTAIPQSISELFSMLNAFHNPVIQLSSVSSENHILPQGSKLYTLPRTESR